MAMRSQVYEYTETTAKTIQDNQTSIFTGGLGTTITKPAETTGHSVRSYRASCSNTKPTIHLRW